MRCRSNSRKQLLPTRSKCPKPLPLLRRSHRSHPLPHHRFQPPLCPRPHRHPEPPLCHQPRRHLELLQHQTCLPPQHPPSHRTHRRQQLPKRRALPRAQLRHLQFPCPSKKQRRLQQHLLTRQQYPRIQFLPQPLLRRRSRAHPKQARNHLQQLLLSPPFQPNRRQLHLRRKPPRSIFNALGLAIWMTRPQRKQQMMLPQCKHPTMMPQPRCRQRHNKLPLSSPRREPKARVAGSVVFARGPRQLIRPRPKKKNSCPRKKRTHCLQGVPLLMAWLAS